MFDFGNFGNFKGIAGDCRRVSILFYLPPMLWGANWRRGPSSGFTNEAKILPSRGSDCWCHVRCQTEMSRMALAYQSTASFGFENGFKSPSVLESTKSMKRDSKVWAMVYLCSVQLGQMCCHKKNNCWSSLQILHVLLRQLWMMQTPKRPDRDGLFTAFDAPTRS